MIDINNLTEILATVNERCFTVVIYSGLAVGEICDLNIVIPKKKMMLNWKSLAFSEKIEDFAFVDFVIYSISKRTNIWGSDWGLLKHVESSSSDYTNCYSLSILRENIQLILQFQDKDSNYILTKIWFGIPTRLVLEKLPIMVEKLTF